MEGKVYAQVYSLIRVERAGLIEALKEFSRIGYDGVEIVSDNSGGLSLDEFKALLKELNLKVIAIHGWGKKVFRMSPIHHHFQLLGWPEDRIVVRFWIVHALLALGLLAAGKALAALLQTA